MSTTLSVVDPNTLVITTDESDVGAFIKIMTDGGAKIEVYSAHDQKSPYGRQNDASN